MKLGTIYRQDTSWDLSPDKVNDCALRYEQIKTTNSKLNYHYE